MHPAVLIPLATAFGAAALAAAIAAREPGQRANRLVAAVLLCDVWWALFEVLCLTAPDAGAALRFARLGTVGSLLLSPVALHLLMVVVPEPMLPHRRLLAAQYAIAAAIVLASLGGPWFAPEVVRMSWGFVPRIGPLVPGRLREPAAGAHDRAAARAAAAHAAAHDAIARESVGRDRDRPQRAGGLGHRLPAAEPGQAVSPARQRERRRLGPGHLVEGLPLPGRGSLAAPVRQRDPRHAPRRRRAGPPRRPDPGAQRQARAAGQARRGAICSAARSASWSRSRRRPPAAPSARASSGAPRARACRSRSRTPGCTTRAASPIGRVLVVRDLEELVSLRSRLLTSARLAAVGQLAAGIAHEINNPIAYVRSNVGLLERHWKDLAAVFESRTSAPGTRAALTRSRELLREAADGIDRIASIVRDVGGFSWKGGAENEPADPVELLETALRVAGPQLRRKASVERSFVKLPLVPCRPQELMQVFLNLVLASVTHDRGARPARLVGRRRRRLRLGRDRGRRRRARARGPGADLRPLLAVAGRRGAGRARARDLAADRGAPGRQDPGRIAAGARHALPRPPAGDAPRPRKGAA